MDYSVENQEKKFFLYKFANILYNRSELMIIFYIYIRKFYYLMIKNDEFIL